MPQDEEAEDLKVCALSEFLTVSQGSSLCMLLHFPTRQLEPVSCALLKLYGRY